VGEIVLDPNPHWPLSGCASLTFPTYHPWLEAPEAGIEAVVALKAGLPVGLCLADARSEPAVLLSVAVARAERKQGVAGTLIRAMAEKLSCRGCDRWVAQVPQGSFLGAMERLLRSRGWSGPWPHMRIYKTATEKMSRIPWVRGLRIPSGVELCPWSDVPIAELEEIKAREGTPGAHPVWLSPFFEEETMVRQTSLVARYGGRVVGWGINHEPATHVHRFTRYWAEGWFQRTGLAVVLMAEAARRIELSHFHQAVCAVHEGNGAMVSFCEKRISPVAFMTKTFEFSKIFSVKTEPKSIN